MSEYRQALFTVPFHIMRLPNLTLAYLRVYEVIFNYWYQNKPCFVGIAKICEKTKLGKTVVYDAINYFIEHGEIIKNGKYFEQPIRKLEMDEVENDVKIPQVRKKFPQVRKKVSADAEYINKQLLTNNYYKNYPSSSDDVDKIETTFKRFWESYPKKVARKEALKIWKRNKLYERVDEIITDINLRKNKTWSTKAKNYIPNPATYLNGERWNDEYIEKDKQNAATQKDRSNAIHDKLQADYLRSIGVNPYPEGGDEAGMDYGNVF